MTPQSLNAASQQPGILGNVLTVCVGKSLISLVIICHMLNRIAMKCFFSPASYRDISSRSKQDGTGIFRGTMVMLMGHARRVLTSAGLEPLGGQPNKS